VIQKYIDAVVEGTARAKNDKPFAMSVLKKYFKSDDDRAMSATYDFFALDVSPSIPNITLDQFKTSIDELGKSDPKVKDYDVSKAIDNSFVKSAADRGLDKKS
jgi:hypothetical protein